MTLSNAHFTVLKQTQACSNLLAVRLAAMRLAIMHSFPKLAPLPASASKHRYFKAVWHVVAPLQRGRHKAALVARAAAHILQVAPQAALRKYARIVRHHQRPGGQRRLRRLLRPRWRIDMVHTAMRRLTYKQSLMWGHHGGR